MTIRKAGESNDANDLANTTKSPTHELLLKDAGFVSPQKPESGKPVEIKDTPHNIKTAGLSWLPSLLLTGEQEPASAKERLLQRLSKNTKEAINRKDSKDTKDPKDTKDAKDDKGDSQTSKVVELSQLSADQIKDIKTTNGTQLLICRYAEYLPLTKEERTALIDRIKNEAGEIAKDKNGYEKLPTFGTATQEGYQLLVQILEKNLVPNAVRALKENQIEMPVGFPLELPTNNRNVPATNDRIIKETLEGAGTLPVHKDRADEKDLAKLEAGFDWLKRFNEAIDQKSFDRRFEAVRKMVEHGDGSTAETTFPKGWAYKEGMDKHQWCSAAEQAIATYSRATSIMEALDYLQRTEEHFKTDGLDKANLPPGVNLDRGRAGNINRVDFGEQMIPNLVLEEEGNSTKLDAITTYVDKYAKLAEQAMEDRVRAGKFDKVYAYGEQEIPNGWYNAEKSEIKMSESDPGAGWTKFNLITHDLKVNKVKDALQPDGMISLTNDVKCKDVPAYAYLNVYGKEIAHKSSTSKPYLPNDYVAVQGSNNKVQLIQAKHLDDWLDGYAGEKVKYWGGKGMTLAMDAGMTISGVSEFKAGYNAAKLGTEGFLKLAANETIKLTAEELPKNMASKLMRKGALEVALGGSGIFTSNAGAHESTVLSGIGHARGIYFMAHAATSLATRPLSSPLMKDARDVFVDKSITAFVGRLESSQQALNDASKLLLKSSNGWTASAKVAEKTFSAADKLFLISATLEGGELLRNKFHPVKLRFLDEAQSKLTDARSQDTGDPRILAGSTALKAAKERMSGDSAVDQNQLFDSQKAMQAEQAVAALRTYQSTLSSAADDSALNDIVDKTTKFLRSAPKEEARTKFITEELMPHLKFDGSRIRSLESSNNNKLNVADIVELEKNDPWLQKDKQKMAGLAALIVGTKADGSLPTVLAERTIVVPALEVLNVGITIPAADLRQELNTERITKLLLSDKQSATTLDGKVNKTESLYRAGIISGEAYGSVLLGVLDSKTQSTKEQKIEAIAHLNSLIASIKVIEQARISGFAADEVTSAQGRSFGLSSSDLRLSLAQAAKRFTDQDLKASAQYALNTLDRKHLDTRDLDDLNAKYSKIPPVVTAEEFKNQMLQALTLPGHPTQADWERKLQAATTLVEMGRETEKARQSFADCLNSNDASASLDTMIKLTTKQPGGHSLLDQLFKNDPQGRAEMVNNIGKHASDMTQNLTDTNLDETKQLELANQRLRFTQALPQLLASGMKDFWVDVNMVTLQGMVQTDDKLHSEPSEKVRAAALTTLSLLGTTNKDNLQAIQNRIDHTHEPVAGVRLAAIDAMERLQRFPELRVAANKLAQNEVDPAVLAKLRKYYEPSGTTSDSDSQASQVEVEKNIDALTNKSVLTAAETAMCLQTNYNQLTQKDDLQGYIHTDTDAHREASKLYADRVQEFRSYERKNWLGQNDWRAEYVTNDLINLELRTQHEAATKYQENLTKLVADAKSGTGQVKVNNTLAPRSEVAIAALSQLLHMPDQLTNSFCRHKADSQNNSGAVSYNDYSNAEMSQRKEMAGNQPDRYDLGAFGKAPWKETQTTAAKALREICEAGEIPVSSVLLKEQLLRAFNSDFADPAAKVELVKGLDALMSRSDTLVASKEEIMKTISEHMSKEHDKTLLMALIDMTRKHERTTFDKFSTPDSTARNKLTALAHATTDVDVRERAIDVRAKGWESVNSIREQVPAEGNSNDLKIRASQLPDPSTLKASKNGDAAVDNATTAIIRACKNSPLIHDDPRREILSKLAEADVNDKIRLAAATALCTSPDVTDRTEAFDTIASIATSSDKDGLRYEALQALDKVSVDDSDIASGSLDFAIGELKAKIKADMVELSPNSKAQKLDTKELIDAVNQYGQTQLDPKTKDKDALLFQKLDMLAGCLARKADLQLKQGGEEKADAMKTLKLALSVYQVNPDSFGKVKINRFSCPDYEQYENEFSKLPTHNVFVDRRHLANCLKECAKVSLANLSVSNYENNKATILVALQMSERVSDAALQKGTMESATAKAQAADIFKQLAIFQRQNDCDTEAEHSFSSAQVRFEKASTEFDAYKKAHPGNIDSGKLANVMMEQSQNCQLRKFGAMSDLVTKNELGAKSYQASFLLRELNDVKNKLEEQQQQSLSGSGALKLATLYWLSARVTEGSARTEHYGKAEAELKKSLNLFSQEGRVAERANALIKLRDLYKETGRPDKAAELTK